MLARSMAQIRKNERSKEERAKVLNMERRKMLCEISMEELISMVTSTERRVQSTFFKVPDPIRRVSEHSYDPRLISFGLYSRGDERWAAMEKVKQEVASCVLKVLRSCNEDEKRDVHIKVAGEKEKIEAIWNHLCDKVVPVGHNESGHYIWKLYSDAPPELSFPVVRHLLVLDAIFLVSFMVFQHSDPRTKSFGPAGFEKYESLRRIFTRAGVLCNLNIIASDIWLFENQIPLILIKKMVREMYVHEEDEGKMTAEQKNAAADRAFEVLVKETVQRVLRVLPGNYKRKVIPDTEGTTTDKILKSRNLRKYAHLLECLYRLVCSVDENHEIQENQGHGDSLIDVGSFTEEKVGKNTFQPVVNVVSFVTHLLKGMKRKSLEKVTEEEVTKRDRGFPKSKAPTPRPKAGKAKKNLDDAYEDGSGNELVRRHSMAKSTRFLESDSLRSGGGGSGVNLSPEPTAGARPSVDLEEGAPDEMKGSEPREIHSGIPRMQHQGETSTTSQELEESVVELQGGEGEPLTGTASSQPKPELHRHVMPTVEEGSPASIVQESRESADQGPSGSKMNRASTKRKRVSIAIEPPSEIDSGPPSPSGGDQGSGYTIARFINNLPQYFDYNYKAAGANQPLGPISPHGYPGAGTRPTEAEEEAVLCLNSKFLTSMCPHETTIKIDSYTLPTVANLLEVGIRVEGDRSPGFNCEVDLHFSPLPWGNASLIISPLNVDGNTERFLRNLVAFEIVSTSEHKLLTYLQCLDDLINTPGDVCLLKEGRHPVILNSSLDERDVAKLFNRMLLNCTVYHNPQLLEIRKKVRLYYLQQWRRGWTEFKERYCVCSKPWVAISLIAGFLVLAMTAVQTAYTVIGYYKA